MNTQNEYIDAYRKKAFCIETNEELSTLREICSALVSRYNKYERFVKKNSKKGFYSVLALKYHARFYQNETLKWFLEEVKKYKDETVQIQISFRNYKEKKRKVKRIKRRFFEKNKRTIQGVQLKLNLK